MAASNAAACRVGFRVQQLTPVASRAKPPTVDSNQKSTARPFFSQSP
jgi:hypothetical protein